VKREEAYPALEGITPHDLELLSGFIARGAASLVEQKHNMDITAAGERALDLFEGAAEAVRHLAEEEGGYYEGITAAATYVPPQRTDKFGRAVDEWGRLVRKKTKR